MGRKTIFILVLLGLGMTLPLRAAKLPVAAPADHGAEAWTWNFDAAREEARKSGKDLFVDFSGSDWCIWCIRLSKEVLHEKAFLDEAKKHFVLVELDYPRGPQEPAVKMQNARLKAKYQIAGFPTVYLMDSHGKPYARTGYRRGGPEPYLKHLDELRAIRTRRDEALKKAKSLKGVDRARALDEALEVLKEAGVLSYYLDEIKEIVSLDGDGTAGLRAKYGKLSDQMAIEAAESQGNFDEALRLIASFRKTYAPEAEELQQLLVKVGMIHYRSKNVAGAIAQFEKARAASPTSPLAQQISTWIEKLRSMSGTRR